MSSRATAFLDSYIATHPDKCVAPTFDAARPGHGASPSPARGRAHRPGASSLTSRKGTAAKGRRLQRMAKAYYESLGARVEIARNGVLWLPSKTGGGRFPISQRHDYFGLWDLLLAWPDGRRGFVQVTTYDGTRERRTKILDAKFPATGEDTILGYEGQKTFRVLRGPGFTLTSERVKV